MIDKVAVDRTTRELGEAGVYVLEPAITPSRHPTFIAVPEASGWR
jgi:hypothetical protein